MASTLRKAGYFIGEQLLKKKLRDEENYWESCVTDNFYDDKLESRGRKPGLGRLFYRLDSIEEFHNLPKDQKAVIVQLLISAKETKDREDQKKRLNGEDPDKIIVTTEYRSQTDYIIKRLLWKISFKLSNFRGWIHWRRHTIGANGHRLMKEHEEDFESTLRELLEFCGFESPAEFIKALDLSDKELRNYRIYPPKDPVFYEQSFEAVIGIAPPLQAKKLKKIGPNYFQEYRDILKEAYPLVDEPLRSRLRPG